MVTTLLLFGSLLAGAFFMRLLVHSPIAPYFGDTPDHRKVHQEIIPRIGGLGMVLGFLFIMGVRPFLPESIWPHTSYPLFAGLIFIALFLLGAGTLDDVRSVNYRVKFLFQFMMAAGIVVILGHRFETFAAFGYRIDLHGFGWLLSIFWIVAVMNAFNIIDGIDGLAGGVALCGIAAIAFMARSNGAFHLYALCACMAGLILAFLRFNFSGYFKMFLGDTGSQFLGAVLAMLAMEVQSLPNTRFSLFVPLFVVGYPLVDTGVAMIRRFLRKGNSRRLSRRFVRMFAADNEHMHHRLVYLGLSHAQSTLLLMILAGGLASTAIINSMLPVNYRLAVIAYQAFAILLILNRLGYLGMKRWISLPRAKVLPEKIVGVVEPDEVFFHSLMSFDQNKYKFLKLPGKLTKFIGEDLVAVTLYNANGDQFEERWAMALRAAEYQDCPAIVIADAKDIDQVKAKSPEGFRSIRFMEKPVRIPDLIRELNKCARVRERKLPKIRRIKPVAASMRERKDVFG